MKVGRLFKNKKLEALHEMLLIVDIHLKRIERVSFELKQLLPMTGEKIKTMSTMQQVYCDILFYRFSHMQLRLEFFQRCLG